MKGNVPVAEATRGEVVLPERVQEALGQLVGAAKEGLLALSVGVGLGVLTELMEEEVDEVVVTTLVDNVYDALLDDSGPVKRAPFKVGTASARQFEGGTTTVGLRAEHGFSALVTVRRGPVTTNLLSDFRWLLVASALATVDAALLIPTYHRVNCRSVGQFKVHR